jgi:hypothetical protein
MYRLERSFRVLVGKARARMLRIRWVRCHHGTNLSMIPVRTSNIEDYQVSLPGNQLYDIDVELFIFKSMSMLLAHSVTAHLGAEVKMPPHPHPFYNTCSVRLEICSILLPEESRTCWSCISADANRFMTKVLHERLYHS